ncbi:MAG: hypothetical protein U9N62_08640 [Thermotogota bacterium]|nr:hypothetical protein [Thermotogota bacterium]
MNSIIKYLGTPRIYTEILTDLQERFPRNSGCFFRQKEMLNGQKFWVLEDVLGFNPKNYQYEQLDHVKEELSNFNHYEFYEGTQLFAKEPVDKDSFETINKLLEIQSLYTVNEEKEEEISKLMYSITGMETIIGSLLEPLPTDEYLQIFSDAFGELLVSSSALYQMDDDYRLVHNHGFEKPVQQIKKLPQKEFSPVNTFPIDVIKSGLYEEIQALKKKYKTIYTIPVQIEGENQYMILIARQKVYNEGERLIINNLSRLLSSIIEYQKLREEMHFDKKTLNRSEFRLQSFYKGLKYLFSVQNVDPFCEKFADMIREIFQVSNVKMFVRKSWGNLLWGYDMEDYKHALTIKYNTVWDMYDLTKEAELEAIEEDFGNLKPFFKLESENGDMPDSAYIIRSLDGNILGIIFLYDFRCEDMEFMKMITEMAGMVLEIIIAQGDFNKMLHSYEEVMEAFQSANALYKKVGRCNGVVDFYNTMKTNLVSCFGISAMYISFKSGETPINFPKNPKKDILRYFEEYYDQDYEDIGIRECENGSILFILPIPVVSKKILLAFEGEDNPKLNVLLQLMQLGFQDKLAAILDEEY